MLESGESQSGGMVTVYYRGEMHEVLRAIEEFILQYANGGYNGHVSHIQHDKIDGRLINFYAECKRYYNCD